MFRYQFDKRPIVENSQRNSVSVFVRHNYLLAKEQLKKYDRGLDLNKEEDAKLFINIVEHGVTVNLKQENREEVSTTEYLNPMKLTYTKSNLNKGFIFWFVCNICGRKVRYLYFPPNSEVLACRNCHRLAYRKQNQSSTSGFKGLFG